MRAKHLHIQEHIDLHRDILKEINATLDLDKKKTGKFFLLKFGFYSFLAAGSYTLIYFITDPVLFSLNFIVFGYLTVLMCFNFAHDLSHNALFKSPSANNFFFEFFYTLVGAHPEAWKERHISSHHFAPNVKNFDTDLNITGLIRLIPGSSHKWYHKYQHIYAPIAYTTYSFYWVFIKDIIVLFSGKHSRKPKNAIYHLKFWFLKAAYILYLFILPVLFSQQGFLTVIIAFLVMHLVQSLYTLFTFFITHHVDRAEYPKANEDGVINTSWFMNQVKSSNDFYPFSKMANFLFGGVNNHVAHHLFPHISHEHYPEVNVILFRKLKENNIIPNQTTYFGGIYSHLKLLRRMGNPLQSV